MIFFSQPLCLVHFLPVIVSENWFGIITSHLETGGKSLNVVLFSFRLMRYLITCPTTKVIVSIEELPSSLLNTKSLIPFTFYHPMFVNEIFVLALILLSSFVTMVLFQLVLGSIPNSLLSLAVLTVDSQLVLVVLPFMQAWVFPKMSFRHLVDGLLLLGKFTFVTILLFGLNCSLHNPITITNLYSLHYFLSPPSTPSTTSAAFS